MTATVSANLIGDGTVETVEGSDSEVATQTTVIQGGNVLWQHTGPIDGWNRRPWDQWIPVDLDGDGAQELFIWNNVDCWSGVLKWLNGALRVIWASPSPVNGPNKQWNRRDDDEFGVCGYGSLKAISVANTNGGWHGIFAWNNGELQTVTITNDDATVPGVVGLNIEWGNPAGVCAAAGLGYFQSGDCSSTYGQITSQDPPAGTLVPVGSIVTGIC